MKPSDLVNDIANHDNLMLAWRKLEGEMSQMDDWCDIMEFYAYKFQLREKLEKLAKKLVEGNYHVKPLRPLPFPKGMSKSGEKRVRQFFHVDIEDQLVWIAYCNVIAQYVEKCMPGWSYGNRISVRVWYDYQDDGRRLLKVGNYRNTKDSIYKKWENSWPRYRKNLSLTIKRMTYGEDADDKSYYEDDEWQLLEDNERFAEQKLCYLDSKYFKKLTDKRLYWAGIDLEKFYPSIDRKLITENLASVIFKDRQSAEFIALTNNLLDFSVNVSGFSPDELNAMGLEESGEYSKGLPTGLFVSGFLANLAMLKIDNIVTKWLKENHKVAHFRYVDDHVVLAQDKESLIAWVKKYITLLEENGFNINKDKIEPSDLSVMLCGDGTGDANIKGLDPFYPSPLMTLTLQKVSQMSKLNVEQLTKTEFDILFADLQELLVMDIPDQEIKKETRISYAVTMLSRTLAHGDVDYEELGRIKRELWKKLESKKLLEKDDWKEWFFRDEKYPQYVPKTDELETDYINEVLDKTNIINWFYYLSEKNRKRKHQHIYNLIAKALEEVPDRTRIWVRMIQFCYKHLPDKIDEVYKMLYKTEMREKLHPLDLDYLQMMLLYKLATMLMADLSRENTERGKGFEESKMLLISALEKKSKGNNTYKYFEVETYIYVSHVLALEQLLSNNVTVKIEPTELYFDDIIDVDFWILFYLQFIKDEDIERKGIAIEKLLPFFITESAYYPSLYLKCVSNPIFQHYSLQNGAFDKALIDYIKRYHLEVDAYRSYHEEKSRLMIGRFLEMESVSDEYEGYITLSDWIFHLKDLVNNEGPSIVKTEHLEYIALKVTKSIVNMMDGFHQDMFYFLENRHINLFNLKIKKECLSRIDDLSYWDNVDEMTTYISTTYPVTSYPFDYSLFPKEYKDVYDIGVILLQMLTLDHLPSDYLVDSEYGYKWERIISNLMSHGHMSFYTYMILLSCLSKRNRETMYIKDKQGDKMRSDEDLDPPIIFSLKELLSFLDEDLRVLRKSRVSLPDNKYRTLVEVSLESFKKYDERIRNNQSSESYLADYLKVDIIQTNLDHRQAWCGLPSKGYLMNRGEMRKCWSEIVMFFKQIMELEDELRPPIVVLPEFAYDKDHYRQLKLLSKKSGCLVIAGGNFVEVSGKQLMNMASVFVPYKWPYNKGATSIQEFEFGKYFFAAVEEKFIKGIGYKPKPYDKMYIVDTGKFRKMGLAICADFYDIERFSIYRGRIQHLIIIAYNKDVKSFYYLAEAISRIVYCNIVICNTGFYGGSIAFVPYEKDYKRYVYKHEGGNLYTNQIVMLPVKGLYEAQHQGNMDFKSKPPGYVAID